MNNEAAVEPQEVADQPIDQIIEQHIDAELSIQEGVNEQQQVESRTTVPLSVAQKLREKKKELELELQWERQERQRLMQAYVPQAPKEDDNSRYESATREELSKSQDEIIRIVEEKQWIKSNPEKYERVNEFLPQFLKQRPNLASAINMSSNRYEEAYTLMDALTPKQQQQIRQASQPRKDAPNAPTSVPKAAAMNEAVDIMSMSDSEFLTWRQSKKRR